MYGQCWWQLGVVTAAWGMFDVGLLLVVAVLLEPVLWFD